MPTEKKKPTFLIEVLEEFVDGERTVVTWDCPGFCDGESFTTLKDARAAAKANLTDDRYEGDE